MATASGGHEEVTAHNFHGSRVALSDRASSLHAARWVLLRPVAWRRDTAGQMVVLLKPTADHARPLFKAPSLTRKKQSPSSCRVLQGPAGLTRPELPGHLLPTRWPCGPLCGPHLPHTTLSKRKTIFGL